jgi:hypothetical protein
MSWKVVVSMFSGGKGSGLWAHKSKDCPSGRRGRPAISMAPSNLTAEEAAVAADFRATIGKTFQNIYGDQWDEDLWQRAKSAPDECRRAM